MIAECYQVECQIPSDEAPALEEELKNPPKDKKLEEELDILDEYYQGDPFSSPGF